MARTIESVYRPPASERAPIRDNDLLDLLAVAPQIFLVLEELQYRRNECEEHDRREAALRDQIYDLEAEIWDLNN
jgi:hypothetical protein